MTNDLGVDADLDVDVKADGMGLLADAVLKLHAGVNDMARQQKQALQLEQWKLDNLPNYISLTQTAPNTATSVIDFGGPQPGRKWVVLYLANVADGLVANAAVPSWFIGPNVSNNIPANLPESMFRWAFTAHPGFQTFTGQVLQVNANERLLCAITGNPAAGVILTANAIINDQLVANNASPVRQA